MLSTLSLLLSFILSLMLVFGLCCSMLSLHCLCLHIFDRVCFSVEIFLYRNHSMARLSSWRLAFLLFIRLTCVLVDVSLSDIVSWTCICVALYIVSFISIGISNCDSFLFLFYKMLLLLLKKFFDCFWIWFNLWYSCKKYHVLHIG